MLVNIASQSSIALPLTLNRWVQLDHLDETGKRKGTRAGRAFPLNASVFKDVRLALCSKKGEKRIEPVETEQPSPIFMPYLCRSWSDARKLKRPPLPC